MANAFLIDYLKINGNVVSGDSNGVFGNGGLLLPMSFGSGSPEGIFQAQVKSMYFDSFGDSLFLKKTGAGNTGWIQLI